MHCRTCDSLLTNRESSLKYPSGEYVDVCDYCFRYIKEDVEVEENPEYMDDDNSIQDEAMDEVSNIEDFSIRTTDW